MGKDYIKRSKRAARAAEKEEKGFETLGPLDPSYGAFTIPNYPYGGKKPTEADATTWAKVPDIPPEAWEKAINTAAQANQEAFQKIDATIWGPAPPTDPSEGVETDASALSTGTEAPKPEAATEHTEAADDNNKSPGDEAKPGDTLPTVIAAVAVDAEVLTRGPVENRMMAKHRWDREGRLLAVEHWMDEKRAKLKDEGMPRYQAADMVWKLAMAEFPPPGTPPPIPVPKPLPAPEITTSAPESADLPGLYSIPPDWPPLPDNAALQVELGWVQSQRLAVVEERGNATIVRLERASSPAPSKAALGWLETSIRSYAKYIEVAAKTLAGAADEAEATRRERMRLDDIRALLDEMHRDAV